jgi:hypothetical protein
LSPELDRLSYLWSAWLVVNRITVIIDWIGQINHELEFEARHQPGSLHYKVKTSNSLLQTKKSTTVFRKGTLYMD